MHLIFDESSAAGKELEEQALVALYRHQPPADPAAVTVRSNFITTLDGSIQGPDGRSGSINTPSDHRIFALHRALADAVLVGAGTARAERYRAVDLTPRQRDLRHELGLAPYPALVVVSRSGHLPSDIGTPPMDHGPVLLATVTAPGTLPAGVDLLMGAARGGSPAEGDGLDLAAVMAALAARGLHRVLCEGGPALHRDLLAAELVDEMSLTVAPVAVGGVGMRSTSGAALASPAAFRLRFALLGEDGALFTHYRRAAHVADPGDRGS